MRKNFFRLSAFIISVIFIILALNCAILNSANDQYGPISSEIYLQQLLYPYYDSAIYQQQLLNQIAQFRKQSYFPIDQLPFSYTQLFNDKQQQTLFGSFNSNLNFYNYSDFYLWQNNYFDNLTYWVPLSNSIPKIPYPDFFSFDDSFLVFQNVYDYKLELLSYLSYLSIQHKSKSSSKIIPSSIKVSSQYITFYCLDQTELLSANLIYSDKNSQVLSAGLGFDSEDPNVVSVNEDGLVTAIGEGSTTITVNYGSFSETINAKVSLPISFKILSLDLVPPTINLTSCEKTERLKAMINYEITFSDMSKNIWPLISDGAEFISSDPNVASVDNNGKVTAVSDGTAVITATQDSFSDSAGLSDSAYVTVTGLNDVVLKIESLKASPACISQGGQTELVCLDASPDPAATLTYQWYLDGAILPESEASMIWTAPLTTGTYNVCCYVSDNYGEEDFCCIDIPVYNVSENNLTILKVSIPSPCNIRAGEYFILTQPNFKAQISEADNLVISCNIGAVGCIEDNTFVYLFKSNYSGYYMVQITFYNVYSGDAYWMEFMIHVLPWWAY